MSRRLGAFALVVVAGAALVAALWSRDARPVHQPAGFRDDVVLSGLEQPMAVVFARDGRVLVAERRGVVKVFSTLHTRRSSVFADLRDHVYELGDHGVFGLALDADDRVYALYTFDGPVGAQTPVWHDRCRGGANSGRCVVSGRLARLDPGGREHLVLEGWCQQFAGHGVGALVAASDGALYASGGEGASYEHVDDGRLGNPCGDPPGEGGALRAQDAIAAGDPLGLSGSVIRLDPATGAYRHVAFGLRNPFRFTLKPGSTEIWIGDVGSTRSDEIDVAEASGAPRNFGWPCYEGGRPLRSYDEAEIPICERLYDSEDAVFGPFAAYPRGEHVVDRDGCEPGTQAISGLAFYSGGAYPDRYRGALFFSDFARRCIWTVLPGENGRPDPRRTELFRAGVRSPVYLTTGPGGDLYYVDFFGGAVRRLRYAGSR